MVTLSIIIPVYNEARTVANLIKTVKGVDLGSIKKELIVVDDGSTDGTREILKGIENIKLLCHNSNKGKGSAIRTGLQHVSGDVVIIQDADMEYDPLEYASLLKPILEDDAKVVFGSRFMRGHEVKENSDKLARYQGNKAYYLGNKFLSFLVGLLYRKRVSDMETCYKVFRREVLDGIKLRAERFDFEPEITAKILKKGYEIIEVPIKYRPRSFADGKKINWTDGIQAIFCLIKYRFFD